jgi:glycylpeptide N-tetradecanoyltransferase
MEKLDNQEDQATEQVEKVEKSKKPRKRNKNKKTPENEKNSSEIVNSVETDVAGSSQGSGNEALTQTLDQEFLNKVRNMRVEEVLKLNKEVSSSIKEYKFWNTQPVPKMSERDNGNESSGFHKAIEPDKAISEIRQDPYPLPDGFTWETLDLNNEIVLRELYTLLNENYVEDDDAMFRFDYQPEFLRWALQPPRWLKEWHVG